MVYSPEEKARMESLLWVFRQYVARHEYYDIVYSEKAGFLRIITEEGQDPTFFRIKGFDDMLRMFIDDHLTDEEYRVGNYMLIDYDRVRSQLTPLFGSMEEGEYCLQFMERQFANRRLRIAHMHEEQLKDDIILNKILELLHQAEKNQECTH